MKLPQIRTNVRILIKKISWKSFFFLLFLHFFACSFACKLAIHIVLLVWSGLTGIFNYFQELWIVWSLLTSKIMQKFLCAESFGVDFLSLTSLRCWMFRFSLRVSIAGLLSGRKKQEDFWVTIFTRKIFKSEICHPRHINTLKKTPITWNS